MDGEIEDVRAENRRLRARIAELKARDQERETMIHSLHGKVTQSSQPQRALPAPTARPPPPPRRRFATRVGLGASMDVELTVDRPLRNLRNSPLGGKQIQSIL